MSALLQDFIPGPVQKISSLGHDSLYIKRLDLIQSWSDGNKYYKLKNNIAFALDNNIKTIVSKGGMFSNHLYSLAHACSNFGIELVCMIRSYGTDGDNPTLSELTSLSKEILFLHPEKYNQFNEAEALRIYPASLFIDEGGKSERALQGIHELMDECLLQHPSHIIISGGTMTTACGLIASAPEEIRIIIVPAWKGCTKQFVKDNLNEFGIVDACEWELWPDAHWGGFAKYDSALVSFMDSFTRTTGIPLDPVYTGKMMFAIDEKIKTGYFRKDDSILAIHSGGLQGIKGFAYRFSEDWGEYEKLVFGDKS
ncbi:MAG TPA: pyridoxal-phosphate dependent enzyme [Saprospiraceae bacterium]|nr:pyridoxal-phosphate dependent enzyme [Saprospiraceae bacterium]